MQTGEPFTSPTFPTSDGRMMEPAQPASVEALERMGRCPVCSSAVLVRDELVTEHRAPAKIGGTCKGSHGRPSRLPLDSCVHCGGDVIPGTTCPRSIACPKCKGTAGGPCYSPSGHRRDVLHAERIRLAELLDSDRADRAAIADELEAMRIAEDGQLGLTVAGEQLALEGLAPAPESSRPARPCVVCGIPTTDRHESPARGGSRGWSSPRCSDVAECADRRNANRKRPR